MNTSSQLEKARYVDMMPKWSVLHAIIMPTETFQSFLSAYVLEVAERIRAIDLVPWPEMPCGCRRYV